MKFKYNNDRSKLIHTETENSLLWDLVQYLELNKYKDPGLKHYKIIEALYLEDMRFLELDDPK